MAASLLLLVLTTTPVSAQDSKPDPWPSYWNQGKAEITSYDLKQVRYGERHQGHAVLIYVTEPFSRSKQVKLDDYRAAGADHVEVLKLNATRKFNTGIYPYSIMTSVFTPAREATPTLKVTSSIQEWCGHVFSQLNARRRGGYRGLLRSYFQTGGDRDLEVPAGAVLEDAIWTQARIDPHELPQGRFKMLPSLLHLRLKHRETKPLPAQATLAPSPNGGSAGQLHYEVTYPTTGRRLLWVLEAEFPHRLLRFKEEQRSGTSASSGSGTTTLTTVATRKAEVMVDYWTKNRNIDRPLRKRLGLTSD